jgi:hypothetical protein
MPIFIAVVAVPSPAVSLGVPVALAPLIPLIAVGAFPLPAIAVPRPLSLLPLIPLVFVSSEQAGRQNKPTDQNQNSRYGSCFHRFFLAFCPEFPF